MISVRSCRRFARPALAAVVLVSACSTVHITGLALTPASSTIAKGTMVQLTATETFSDNTTQDVTNNASWTSSDTSIATVSSSGLVTGVSPGTVTVTATSAGFSGTATVTVTAASLTSIAVTPPNPSIAAGTTKQFTATGTFSDQTTQNITAQVTWSSATAAAATISSAGLATGVAVGTSTISASLSGKTGSTVLTVTAATLTSIAVTPASPSIAAGTTKQFTAIGTYSDKTAQDITSLVTWSSATPSVATVSSQGLATGLAVGTSTIAAALSGQTGSTVLTVTAAALTSISVTPVNPSIAAGTPKQFTATGTYSDKTTQDITTQVLWTSGTTSVATISNATGSRGLATGAGVGTSTISATLSGQTGTTTLTVTAATLTAIAVTPANPTIAAGTSKQFTATGTYTDKTTQDVTNQVLWTSATTSVATISNANGSRGLATGAGMGTSTISATLSGQTGSTVLTVTAATLSSIAITPANPSIAAGTSKQFTATGTYSDTTTQDITSQVLWTSGTTSVATISNASGSSGLATAAAVGTTTISATLSGQTGSTLLTVTAATLTSIAVTPANPSIAAGTSKQFTATGTYSDTTTQDITSQATWTSGTTSVASISNASGSQGLATGAAVGTTTISASLLGQTGSTLLTVTAATLTSIAVTPVNPSIAAGTPKQFTATGTYSDKTTQDVTAQVTWSSATPSVASISNASGSNGLATSAAVGTTAISATLSGFSDSTVLTVTAATLSSIAVSPPTQSLPAGLNQAYIATGTYTDKTTQDVTQQVTWASSNTSVATISNAAGSQGLASTSTPGTTNITASLNGVVSDASVLQVTNATLQSIAITPTTPQLPLATTLQLAATGTYSDASTHDVTGLATWGTTAPLVASVSNAAGSQGLASALAQGSATVTASLAGVNGSTTLTVTPAALVSIAVTPTNPAIANGTTKQFVATGTYTDNSTENITNAVTWASSATSVATISNASGSQGLASSLAVGSSTISASLSGQTGTSLLTVTPATLVTLAVTPAGASIAKGTTKQFTATGTYTDNSTQDLTAAVTWSAVDGTVVSVSNVAGSNGLATGLGVGTTNVIATLGSVTAFTAFTVSPATLVSISVTSLNAAIAKGTSEAFTATGVYTDNSTQDLTTQVSWASSDITKVTVSNASGSQGVAQAVDIGSATISASLLGTTGSTGLSVTAATLVSIAVTPPSPSIPTQLSVAFTAVGTYTDNSTQDLTTQATWTSSAPAVATVSNAVGSQGSANTLTAGTTTITATRGLVSGSATLTVNSATLVQVTVEPANPTIPKGTNQSFTAFGFYSNSTKFDLSKFATWASSNLGVATVSNASGSQGLANGTGVGSATISATYTGVVGQTTLNVSAATLVSIALQPVNPSVPNGSPEQFQAIGTYTDNSTQDITTAVSWTSTNTLVATIGASTGLAQSLSLGMTSITAAQGMVTSPATTLTVTSAVLKSIDVEPASPSIAAGTTQQFKATGIYTDSTTQDLTTQVSWSSTDTNVVSISNAAGSAGLATSAIPGLVTISATLNGIVGSTPLTVTAATLVSIAVTPSAPSIAKGTSKQFTATGTYTDASQTDLTTQVTWSSSAPATATVSDLAGSQGLAMGAGVGTATISAALSGKTGMTTLSVTAATLVSVAVTPATPSIARGTTIQFTATGTYTDATTQDLTTQVTWSASAAGVASISNGGSQGLATGLSVGTTSITATSGTVSGSTNLTVTSATLVSIAVTPQNQTIPVHSTLQFTATGTYTDNSTQDLTTQVAWTSSLPGSVSISDAVGSQGLATALASGPVVITAATATLSGTANVTVQ